MEYFKSINHVGHVFQCIVFQWQFIVMGYFPGDRYVTYVSWADAFQGIGLDYWDVGNIRNMESMFNYATTLVANLSSWHTAMVTNMAYMFDTACSFDGNLSQWDTSQVTDMTAMFRTRFWYEGYCRSSFRGHGLSQWDVSKVVTMSAMFESATE
jgi:surface protein